MHLAQPAPAGPRLGVGLRDGSWLVCDRLAGRRGDASTSGLQLHLLAGLDLTCRDLQNLVALQQLGSTAAGSPLVYLSDLKAASYSHQAYLEIPWPTESTRMYGGARLRVQRRVYLKVWGCTPLHGSRIVSQVGGSGWLPKWPSTRCPGSGGVSFFGWNCWAKGSGRKPTAVPIVRGGQPPRGLAVELAGAEQLALITEYADRGDEWDDANWLDARLESQVISRESGQEPGDP